MPIKLVCDCGKKYSVKDEHAGKRVKCADCGTVLGVPLNSVFVTNSDPKPAANTVPAPAALKRPFWKDPVVVIGGLVPALILAVFLGYLYRENSRARLRDLISENKALADKLLKEGKAIEAHDAYRKLLDDVGGSDPGDSQSKANLETVSSALKILGPSVEAEKQRLANLRRETEEKERQKAARIAEAEALSRLKADLSGTVFVTLKSGDPKVVPGTKVTLIKAELPRSQLMYLIAQTTNARDIEIKKDSVLTKEEFEFFRDSIKRLVAVKEDDVEPLVDTKVMYGASRVGQGLDAADADSHARIWQETVRMAKVAETFTSLSGEYKFETVPGGRYYLVAEHTLFRSLIEWVSPVNLDKPGAHKMDLHNAMATLIINAPG
jgi:hypothetical protein